jgi:hypothetical protein
MNTVNGRACRRMGNAIKAFQILGTKLEKKRLLRRLRRRWED